VTDLAALIARVREAGDPDAAQLAAIVEQVLATPDKRVGAAFRVRRKGGEPRRRTERREARDCAIRDLAQTIGSDLSLEERAQEIIQRASRYRPAPCDASGSAERRALRQIAETGLPVPGERQLKRILIGTESDMQTPLWMSEKLPHVSVSDTGENNAGNRRG